MAPFFLSFSTTLVWSEAEKKRASDWQSSSDVRVMCAHWGLTEEPRQRMNREQRAAPEILDGRWIDAATVFSCSFPISHMHVFQVMSNKNSSVWDTECGLNKPHFELFTETKQRKTHERKLYFKKLRSENPTKTWITGCTNTARWAKTQLNGTEKSICHQCTPLSINTCIYHLKTWWEIQTDYFLKALFGWHLAELVHRSCFYLFPTGDLSYQCNLETVVCPVG